MIRIFPEAHIISKRFFCKKHLDCTHDLIIFSPLSAIIQSPKKRRRDVFNSKIAKHKWDTIEKTVSQTINRRQTMTNMEKDMERWLKVRY